jgi:hypothetical protein
VIPLLNISKTIAEPKTAHAIVDLFLYRELKFRSYSRGIESVEDGVHV